MIKPASGNILDAKTEALVNTVNTVGVMGKGIALQFKEKFPKNFELYRKAFERGELKVGKMLVTDLGTFENPRYLINFPTKEHWRGRSRYEYVTEGLSDLVNVIRNQHIRSIAIPPLGCGNGGLDWTKVKQLITDALEPLPDIEVLLFEPAGAPFVHTKTSNGKLTPARAMVISLAMRYVELGYELTLLEIQKLAYFLQRFGERDSLRLSFQKHHYGPYAHNLTHLLRALDGTYLVAEKGTAIADSRPFDHLLPVAEKQEEVAQYLQTNGSPEQWARLQKVQTLIEGFETPFGMELLATADWLLHENPSFSNEALTAAVHAWSERKKRLMQPPHLAAAARRLMQFRQELYV